MTVLYIISALILIFVCAVAALFIYACAPRKVDDMWDEEMVRKHGFGALWDDIREGRDWLLTQQRQPLQLVSCEGKLLDGFFLPCENARGTIILFHGWRSSWKLDFSSVFRYYNSLGLNIIAVSQRAQGISEGRFITFGVRERFDVDSWVTYAGQLLGEDEPIFLSGVSMGATTVLMSARCDFTANVRGIIADSAFTSPYDIMASVLSRKLPYIPVKPVLWTLNIFTRLFACFGLKEYSTMEAMKEHKYPVLFIHGTADDFVPCQMSRQNYEICAAHKELLLIEGAGHTLSFHTDRPRVQAAFEAFVDKYI